MKLFLGIISLKQASANLFAVKWFQILLSYTNSFICTQLYGFKCRKLLNISI